MPVRDSVLNAVQATDLWTLVFQQPQFDPSQLAAAIERQVAQGQLDFRTRLLIRDSLAALATVWEPRRLNEWIEQSPLGEQMGAIARAELGPPGFPSLAQRLMDHTKPEIVLQFLRELGLRVSQPVRIAIGGSIALILSNRLARRTDDIDIVDEVPAELRSEHELLDGLSRRYGLRVTHFQSHYLPTGWDSRLKSYGQFGRIEVRLIDEYDIALSKFFSNREKDRDDLRVLGSQLDKGKLTDRLQTAGRALLDEPPLRQHAQENWYIVYGEPLPA